jgi:hypothetical protein
MMSGVNSRAPQPRRSSVTDLAWCDSRRCGVATFWTRIEGRTPRFDYSAAIIKPDDGAELLRIWPHLQPRRVIPAGPEGLAVACADGSLHIMASIDPNAKHVLLGRHPDGEPDELLCTADGGILLSRGPHYLCAWAVDSQRLLWPALADGILCSVMHPRREELFCAHSNGRLERLDAQTGRVLCSDELPTHETAAHLVVFPDGVRAASMTAKHSLCVWRLDASELLWSRSLLTVAPHSLSVSPDGRWLAVATLSGGRWRIACFDAQTGHRQDLSAPVSGPIHGTLFTLAGEIICWDAQGSIRLWRPASPSAPIQWTPGNLLSSF